MEKFETNSTIIEKTKEGSSRSFGITIGTAVLVASLSSCTTENNHVHTYPNASDSGNEHLPQEDNSQNLWGPYRFNIGNAGIGIIDPISKTYIIEFDAFPNGDVYMTQQQIDRIISFGNQDLLLVTSSYGEGRDSATININGSVEKILEGSYGIAKITNSFEILKSLDTEMNHTNCSVVAGVSAHINNAYLDYDFYEKISEILGVQKNSGYTYRFDEVAYTCDQRIAESYIDRNGGTISIRTPSF